GVCPCFPLSDQFPNNLNPSLWLLIGHRLDAAGMLQLHLPRHEQGANLHVCRRVLLTHFFNPGRAVLFEVRSEREQEVLVERSTPSLQGPARVSKSESMRSSGERWRTRGGLDPSFVAARPHLAAAEAP